MSITKAKTLIFTEMSSVCLFVGIMRNKQIQGVYCCFFTLDAGLLARSQYSEGPATGHLEIGFSWFPCVYNPLTPNDLYMSRTAPLTSKSCILYIYSTNVGTEYFKHAPYSPFFSLQNAVCFIMLTCLVPVLFIFCIQSVLKLKKNNFGAKGISQFWDGSQDSKLPLHSSHLALPT